MTRRLPSNNSGSALNRRVIIEQAKGVLAQHLGVAMDTAFDRLRRYARGNNLRLAEVARRCVAGELNLDVVSPANRPRPTHPRPTHPRTPTPR